MFNIVEKELFRWRRVRKNGREMSICTKLLVIGQIVFSSINIAMAATTATGGAVVGGAANGTIAQVPNAGGGINTTVTQTGSRATNTWVTLGTAATDNLTFVQQPTDVSINKVTGNESSEFYGSLTASGRVFILNPYGVTFGAGSQTNIGALIATTARDVTETPDGVFLFTGSGYGQVINHGNIHVSNGGFAILAAPYVENTGFIQANLGQIQLASAKDFTVDLRGDGLIDFTVSKETMNAIANDAKLGVTNTGTLQAQSGIINISAGLASDIVQSVVNLGGVVDADAFSAGHNGGTVLVTSVGDLNNTGSIHADGGVDDNGGTIKTWSDGTNLFEAGATMSARGGANGGDGGFVEVSGNHVALRGNVDVAAPNGSVGTLLIDPTNLTIKDGGGVNDTDVVYENYVEGFAGNLVLEASHSITVNDLTDNVLQRGNNGALELKVTDADSAIFANAGDTIATTGNYANITLSAGSGGIHVGNLSTGGPGVSNPGEISLTTTNGGDIVTSNITITADGAEGAAAYMSANAAGSLTTGNISVTASANSYSSTYASAEADLIAGSNITVTGDAKVKATAKSSIGDANATAMLLAAAGVKSVVPTDTGASLTFVTGNLNITGDVHVNADASANDGNVNASAEAFLVAGNDVNITTGPTTLQVTANATTGWGDANAAAILLAAAGVSELSVSEGEGNSTVKADFGTGSLNINGNIYVTADANAYAGNATAMAAAILAAGDDVNIDTYGTLNVAATAYSNGSTDEGNRDSATAFAGLVALAGLDNITVSETTTSAPAVTMAASSGNLGITGDVHVSADATVGSSGNGNALAGAAAILAAGNNVDIATGMATLKVASSATNDGYGDADAGAALIVASGVNSLGFGADYTPTVTYGSSGDLTISGNILVTAKAWEYSAEEFGGGHAAAFTNLLAAGSTSVWNDITVTATADHSEVTVGDLKTIGYDADITLAAFDANGNSGDANNGVVNAGNLQTTDQYADIDVTAGSGGIKTGNLTTGGEGDGVAHPGEIWLTTTNGGNINTGNISIIAEAYNADTASATLNINAAGNVQTGTILVSADASPTFDSNAYASANANVTAGSDITIVGDITVKANAEGAYASYAQAYASAILSAGNDVNITGNTAVQSTAVMTDGANAYASATLSVSADRDINITGDTLVTAQTTQTGSANVYESTAVTAYATAYANVAYTAGRDINIVGNTVVTAQATQNGALSASESAYVTAYANATATAGATYMAGNDINITGDTIVTAKTTQTASVYASSSAYAAVNAYADAEANLYAYAKNDLNVIKGDIQVLADATQTVTGNAGNGANTNANASAGAYLGNYYYDESAGNNVNINGDITVKASANNSGPYAGYANAYAYLYGYAGNELNVTGNIDVEAAAARDASEGANSDYYYDYANANAYAYLGNYYYDYADNNVNINGDITVKASATNSGPYAGYANASAYLYGYAGNELNVTGNIDVEAAAARDASVGANSDYDYYHYANANAGAYLGSYYYYYYGYANNNVNIVGDITVKATADNTGPYAGYAYANAYLYGYAGNELNVTGNIDVEAAAARDITKGENRYYNYAYANANAYLGSYYYYYYGYADNNVNTVGDITVKATADNTGPGYANASAYLDGYAGNELNVTGNIDVEAAAARDASKGANSDYDYANANANAYLGSYYYYDYADNNVNINGNVTVRAMSQGDGAEGYAYLYGWVGNDLSIKGDVLVTADATQPAGTESNDSTYTQAYAQAYLNAGHNVTIDTDPVTVAATATSQHGNSYAYAYLNASAGDGGEGVAPGDLYITGDVSATAKASGGDYNSGNAYVNLYAPGNLTVLYGTTPPKAYAPNPDDPAHALVQAPAHGADDFYDYDSSGDGETGNFYASVNINAGGKVTIEPKSVAPSGCGRDECEVVNALEARRVDPIEPLPTGRDPLRIAQDGLVLWPTGAGVTAPSTGAIITADMESAIAAGADPTTLLPATAAGGVGLSAGLDAFSIGGTDYCDQVVSGFCLPEAGGKAKK